MKKLFVDTNIAIDLFEKREPFYPHAANLFSMADKGKVKLFVSSLTFEIANYLISKANSSSRTREILLKFKILVTVLSLSDKVVDLALNDRSFPDFEDGLQYHTAIVNESEMIITRNLKDYKNSRIPVMTAQQYMARIDTISNE